MNPTVVRDLHRPVPFGELVRFLDRRAHQAQSAFWDEREDALLVTFGTHALVCRPVTREDLAGVLGEERILDAERGWLVEGGEAGHPRGEAWLVHPDGMTTALIPDPDRFRAAFQLLVTHAARDWAAA